MRSLPARIMMMSTKSAIQDLIAVAQRGDMLSTMSLVTGQFVPQPTQRLQREGWHDEWKENRSLDHPKSLSLNKITRPCFSL